VIVGTVVVGIGVAGVATAGLTPAPVSGDLGSAGGFVYKADRFRDLDPNSSTTQTVSCPRHSVAISGGVRLAGIPIGAAVVESAPFDSPDSKKTPDDGWLATVENTGDEPVTLLIYAICKKT
jgi:hypothetical protein